MFPAFAAFIAHLLLALGAPAFTVALPGQSFEAAEAARTCVTFTVPAVLCTDGLTGQ